MEIFVKMLIGFAVFFTGVVCNVSVMRKTEGKPQGVLPYLSFFVICAGLVILVWMAGTITIPR